MARFLEPGFRFLPFEFVIHLGFPLESKTKFAAKPKSWN